MRRSSMQEKDHPSVKRPPSMCGRTIGESIAHFGTTALV
jgi:hypothetical protein